ncbi:MAG TPA: VOC family protein [Polyangiaceae bacterium]|nr:VOC family protein [Polyangiaceae bacterium]
MPRILINLDVDDVERAIRFYTEAFDLRLGRRFDAEFVELIGAEAPIYLLAKANGSQPFKSASVGRDYGRHWTPMHLDFVVENLDAALARAQAAGARVESEISEHAYGRLVLCSDPFGHGFCLLEFRGRGYGELVRTG